MSSILRSAIRGAITANNSSIADKVSTRSSIIRSTTRGLTPSNSIQGSVDNSLVRLAAAGAEPPKLEGNFLTSVLNNLGRTGYAATNMMREFSNRDSGNTPGEFDPFKAFWRGLTLQEMPSGKDVMTDLGLNGEQGIFGGEAKWYNPSLAGAAGLALDIVNPLDPLNWVDFGLSKAVTNTGLKGSKALQRVFGSKGAEIAAKFGDDILDTLSAPTAGKLMGKVGKAATKAGLDNDTLGSLLKLMKEGMEETGVKATTRLPYSAERAVTVGLQNPLTLGMGKKFAEVDIPGTKKVVGGISKLRDAFMNTKVGDALGKAFSTRHIPRNVPDTVIVRDVTGRQMDDLIERSGVSTFNSPLSRDELIALKNEISGMKPLSTTFDVNNPQAGTHLSFQAIADSVGMDPNLTRVLFETELPFTMSIEDIYKSLSNSALNSGTAKEIFTQSVKLRKVMDTLTDSVPDELIPFFKGTVITPTRIPSFEGSPLNNIPQGTNESPMINYVFNHKGVDIAVAVNTSKSFNDNIWVKLGGTIRAIDELPAQNLQVLKNRIQISPMNLGKESGQAVGGYAIGDELIVLGNPAKQSLAHEYGHIWQKAGGKIPDYYDIIKQDAGLRPEDSLTRDNLISDYAKSTFPEDTAFMEDFADSVVKYFNDPNFKAGYPGRSSYIQDVLSKTQISPEELDKLVKDQTTRANTISNMPKTDEQIDQIIGQIDSEITKNLTKKGLTEEGSEAYKEFRGKLTEIFEQSAQRVEDFVRQVEVIFKDVPVGERKQIMEIAAGGYTGKASGLTGTVQPAFQKEIAPIWYTKTKKNVLPKMGNKMPVDQFRNLLKSQGVKPEEIKWLGIEDLLDGKSVVTKADLQDWLKWNNLDIQEVTKGGRYNDLLNLDNFKNTSWYKQLEEKGLVDGAKEYISGFSQIDDEAIGDIAYGISDFAEDNGLNLHPATIYNDMSAIKPVNTKFSQYTLPGGEDYQELLFTLPVEKAQHTPEQQALLDQWRDLEQEVEGIDPIDLARDDWAMKPEIKQYYQRRDELRMALNEAGLHGDEIDFPNQVGVKFQSQHWDEPNVVAHTRFDTRYTPDGQKVLFVEEIQSDWHEAGRTKGYIHPEDNGRVEELKTKIGELKQKQADLTEQFNQYRSQFWESTGPNSQRYVGHETKETRAIGNGLKKQMSEIRDQLDPLELELDNLNSKAYNGVAEAPFEKSWPELVEKRLIRYAAENGYDRIAWTTGAQQASRYSLSQTVDKLVYNLEDQSLTAFKGIHQMFDKKVPQEQLGDYVGKEAAINLLQKKPNERGLRVLEGTDLEVGGSGMKGFYDQMVPNQFEKLGKKYGVKVENVDVPVDYVSKEIRDLVDNDGIYDSLYYLADRDGSFTAENLAEESLTVMDTLREDGSNIAFTKPEAQRMANLFVSTAESIGDGDKELIRFLNSEKAKQNIADALYKKYPMPEVPLSTQMSIPITPQLREVALGEGFPLFQKGEAPESTLSEPAQNALNAFLKWRDSVVKTYKDMQVPINELENYVPFIPVRGLKTEEQEALRTMFGTGMKSGEELDTLLEMLSKTDPNLKQRTTKARSPAEVNKILNKEWLTEDAALAMSLRGTRAIKAQGVSDFLKDFITKYGLKYDDLVAEAGGQIPQGYKMYITHIDGSGKKTLQEVFDAAGLAKKDIEGFFLPEEMAKVYNEYADLIFGVKAKNPLLKVYDSATSAYKKVAYLWNPGHIPRDFFGNVFNGYLMGIVNPVEYVNAAKLLLNPDTVIELPAGKMTAKELLDKAQKIGVLDVGAAVAETPRDMIDRLNLKGNNVVKNTIGKYSTLMRQGTKASDTLTRFTGLLHELNAGKSFTEAAAQVKKFYFDYFDLTPFERKVMKRIIPFYTWMRKNIPLQVEQLIKSPRKLARVGDVMNAANGEAINWDEEPEYIREGAAFQLGEGGPYISPNMPYQDLSKVPTNLDALLQLLSGVNPIIRAPIEVATNAQWFNGQPLEDYSGETREMPLAGLLKALGMSSGDVPRINKRTAGHLLDQIPLLRNIDVMTNSDAQRSTSRLSSFIGGPSIYSSEGVQKSKEYEEKRRLEEFIRKLQDEGTEVPTVKEIKKSSKSRSIIKSSAGR